MEPNLVGIWRPQPTRRSRTPRGKGRFAAAAVVAGCTHMGTACVQSPLSGEDVGTAAMDGGGDRTDRVS